MRKILIKVYHLLNKFLISCFNVRLKIVKVPKLLKKGIIYIHVPKVAGHGMLKSIGFTPDRHIPFYWYDMHFNSKNYYKYTVVRNPLDRFVSAYHFLHQGREYFDNTISTEKVFSNFETFDDFIEMMRNSKEFETWVMSDLHFRPQNYWIKDLSQKINMDYIGKFEQLDDAFGVLKKLFNKPEAKLSKLNSSKREKYIKYYTKESMMYVYSLYREDFFLFDYIDDYNKDLEELKKNNGNK